jgi:DGQHR domain-containing protein
VNANGSVVFKCLEVSQPIGTFYVGAMDSKDLVRISYADVRRIERRDVEEYLGIERPLSAGRVAELKQYVTMMDAAFPSNVILAVASDKAAYDSGAGTMTIANEEDVAKIIDGQHRIAGLQNYSGPSFQVGATIFIDMDIEDQAMVFATINLKQTKVSKSLAYDLYEYAVSRSPQKTCHNIAKLLNSKNGSPFKDKIKILGVATGKPEETITQATFVDRLIGYISKDPMRDRDDLKRKRKLRRAEGREASRLIFRNLFIDEHDAQIARIIWNYFSAVELTWPRAWRVAKRGNVLNRSTGFGALMRFLRVAYLHLAKPGEAVETPRFESLFAGIGLTDDSFTAESFLPGSAGEGELYRALCSGTQLEG